MNPKSKCVGSVFIVLEKMDDEQVGNRYHYRVVNRPVELPELKLLVDAIHNAISENKKIKFQYYQWNAKRG